MLDLTPIEKRLAGISKWPWQGKDRFIWDATGHGIGCSYAYPYESCSGENNLAFIASAPQNVSDLIEEVKRLRGVLVLLKDMMLDVVIEGGPH